MSIRESQFDLDPSLAALDHQLRDAMKATPPAGLVDRIHTATVAQLTAAAAEQAQLEADLRQALHVATPPDMAARIYRATAAQLQDVDQPAVIGRIGWAWRSAVAAAVAIAAGSAMWFAVQQPSTPAGPDSPIAASLPANPEMTALRTELHRFEQVIAPQADPLNTQLLALRVELDGMSLAMETERLNAPGDQSLDQLQAELHLLEAEVQAF